jgi:hypothetical protein
MAFLGRRRGRPAGDVFGAGLCSPARGEKITLARGLEQDELLADLKPGNWQGLCVPARERNRLAFTQNC